MKNPVEAPAQDLLPADSNTKFEVFLVYALVGALIIYGLFFLFYTGFISDDAYNSQLPGSMLHEGKTLVQVVANHFRGWMLGSGRIFPVSVYCYLLFSLGPPLVLYKALNLFVILGASFSFGKWVELYSGVPRLGMLSMLGLTGYYQLRAWHDPILAFHFLLPFLALNLFVSLFFFQRILTQPSRLYLAASVFFFTISCLTYEVGQFYGPIFLGSAWLFLGDLKKAIKASRWHLGISFFIILLGFILRSKLNPYYEAIYVIGAKTLDPIHWIHASLIQLSAALPLSYYFKMRSTLVPELRPYDFAFLLGVGALSVKIMWRNRDFSRTQFLRLFPIGIALWGLPGVLTAASSHQEELLGVGYGMGYLPVFLQYFGSCLAMSSLWLWLIAGIRHRSTQSFVIVLSCLAFVVVSAINLGANRAVALGTNAFWKFPRDVIEAALESKEFVEEIGDNATLLRNGRVPADHTWFYTMKVGKKISGLELAEYFGGRHKQGRLFSVPPVAANLKPLGELRDWIPETVDQNPVYLLMYQFDRRAGKTGTAVLARLKSATLQAADGMPRALYFEEMRIFDYRSRQVVRLKAIEGRRWDFMNLFKLSDGEPSSAAQLLSALNAEHK